MWIQLIKARLKSGHEAGLTAILDHLKAIEMPDSGLVRTVTSRSTTDPNAVYVIVTFESEEKAREREQDPRRREGLEVLRRLMGETFDGPPEFVELDVVGEYTG